MNICLDCVRVYSFSKIMCIFVLKKCNHTAHFARSLIFCGCCIREQMLDKSIVQVVFIDLWFGIARPGSKSQEKQIRKSPIAIT